MGKTLRSTTSSILRRLARRGLTRVSDHRTVPKRKPRQGLACRGFTTPTTNNFFHLIRDIALKYCAAEAALRCWSCIASSSRKVPKSRVVERSISAHSGRTSGPIPSRPNSLATLTMNSIRRMSWRLPLADSNALNAINSAMAVSSRCAWWSDCITAHRTGFANGL